MRRKESGKRANKRAQNVEQKIENIAQEQEHEQITGA
jgi:hypothetical protein